MSIVAFDDVQETTSTTGTGDLILAGAATAFRSFSSCCADGDQFSYTVRDITGGTNFESGIGRYNSGANSVTRLEITASSNAGARVNFTAGIRSLFITVLSKQIKPLGAYPWDNTTGCIGRWNALLSTVTLSALGYATKITDISGSGNDSDTNTTNPPKFAHRGFNVGFPALYFDFSMKHTFSTVPQLASPLKGTIIIVAQDLEASGNSHIYNWAGNPIGFGSTTPLDFMFNGTLSAAHPSAQVILQDHRPKAYQSTYPVVAIHCYDGAASVNSINDNDFSTGNVGTSASGTTHLFTIGSDSSSGVGGGTANTSRMLLFEMAIFNFTMNSTDRANARAYYKALCGISTP